MGKFFLMYEEGHNVYVCKVCKAHLSSRSKVLAKTFKGKYGRSFLVSKMINVGLGPEEEKILLTGIHVVQDVRCINCDCYVGWAYVRAYEASEKYKEGKFIMERNLVVKNDWV